MPVFNKRSRIVSFRVSDKEYETLVEISAKQGANSVSDFARSMAFLTINQNCSVPEIKIQAQIVDLKARLQQLGDEVTMLRQRIEERPAGDRPAIGGDAIQQPSR